MVSRLPASVSTGAWALLLIINVSLTRRTDIRTSFTLNVPAGLDYPLALVTKNSTTNPHFRAQFYVNGWQFGKYGESTHTGTLIVLVLNLRTSQPTLSVRRRLSQFVSRCTGFLWVGSS